MPFDPSTATPDEGRAPTPRTRRGTFDPSTAFDPTSATPDDGPPPSVVMSAAVGFKPEAMAEATRLAKRYPVPVDTAYRNLEALRAHQMVEDSAAKLQVAAGLRKYLAANPAAAAMAQEDVGTLAKIESNFAAVAAASVGQAVLGISEGIWRTPDAAQRAVGYLAGQVERTGLPKYLNPIRGVQDVLKFISEGQAPVGPKLFAGTNDAAAAVNDAQKMLADSPATFGPTFKDVQTLAQNADKALVAAVKTGNVQQVAQVITDPNYWAAFMSQAVPSLYLAAKSGGSAAFMGWLEGMEQAGNAAEFEKKTGQKISDAEFTQAVAQTAIVNALLEKYGLDKVLGAKGQGLKGIAKAMLGEGGTEGLQQVNSNLAAALAYDEGKSLTEGVLASVMGGIGSGAGVSSTQAATNKIASMAAQQAQQAGAAKQFSDHLAEQLATAETSKLRQLHPETFREAVQAMEPAPVYVDAEVLNQLPGDLLNQLPAEVRQQLADELPRGGMVEIPGADVLTLAPGTPLAQALAEHGRAEPFALSAAEAKQAQASAAEIVQREGQRIVEQAQADEAFRASADGVRASVLAELQAAGRFSPAVNEQYATWLGAFVSTMAQRTGSTPEAFYAAHRVRILGAPSAAASGPVMEQGGAFDLAPGYRSVTVGNTSVEYTVDRDGKRVEVSMVGTPKESRGQGSARQALTQLLAAADARGMQVVLTAEPMDKSTSKAKLEAFYKSLGFVPNKGRNKDFTTMAGMVRPPRAQSATGNRATASGPVMGSPLEQPGAPAFDAWFGDSKVRDAEGKPLVVYHGTGADFGDVFNTSGGTGKTFGTGAFFSSSTAVANSYATGEARNVVPVYISLKTPLVVDAGGANWNRIAQKARVEMPEVTAATTTAQEDENLLAELEGRAPETVKPTKRKAKKTDVRELFKGEWDYPDDTASTDDIARWARKQGYDGVIFRNVMDRGPSGAFDYEDALKPADLYVAFRPEQIKSATGNNGNFDPKNPSILEQAAAQPLATFNPRSLELVLNPNANLSSFFHEAGHFFLEVMADIASQPNAPAQIAEDMGAFLKWAGVADLQTWNALDLDGKRQYHERWAESIEQYVMEGKAPSVELQPLMRRFSAWLKSVYGSIKRFLESRGQVVGGGEALNQAAYHGTPHRGIDKFSTDAIGTGEGNQAYGWGLYFASKRGIAEHYRKALSSGYAPTLVKDGVELNSAADIARAYYQVGRVYNGYGGRDVVLGFTQDGPYRWSVQVQEVGADGKPKPGTRPRSHSTMPDFKDLERVLTAEGYEVRRGQLYEVELPEDDNLLLWDKPLGQQPEKVREALAQASEQFPAYSLASARKLSDFYLYVSEALGSDKAASEAMAALGIKGIKYLDGTSRGAGDGSYNYVIFSGDDVAITDQFYQDPAAQPGPQMALNDDIRRVMDRLLATDEQIAQANEAAGLAPDAEADATAAERLNKRSMADLKWSVKARDQVIAKLRKQAKSIERGIRDQVTTEVNARPEVLAKEAIEKAEKDHEKDPFSADLNVAVIADNNGFQSVDAMYRAIDAFGNKADVIDGITERRMLEEHGDLIDERAIANAANEAVHNEARARSLATELRTQAEMLGTRTDTGETNAAGSKITVNALVEAAKQFGRQTVARTPVKDLRAVAWRHTAAERRAARRWSQATAKGDTTAAVQAKQDQMLQHAAATAAHEAIDEAQKVRDFFARVVKGNDETVVEKGRDPDIVNAARAVLGAYGVQTPTTKKAAAYLNLVKEHDPETFGAIEPAVTAALENAQPLTALPLPELQALGESIDALWHLAKRTRQSEIDGALVDREDLAAELVAQMETKGVPIALPGEGGAVTKAEARALFFQKGLAFLRRVEAWAEAMDGGYGGPFLRYVFQPVRDAAVRYRTDRKAYRKRLQELVSAVEPIIGEQTIDAPELGYTFGRPGSVRGTAMNEILHAIAHTGNESNKRKLLLGRKWATENADGTLDTSRWDAFLERLVAEGKLRRGHFDFVQGLWDLLEETKPLAQAAHRDAFGRFFNEVTAAGFVDPFGVARRGGYVPAMVDPDLVKDNQLRKLAEEDNANLAYAFPSPAKGFTVSRVESYTRPLLLDLRTISQHLDKVLLFSHMTVPAADVRRLVTHKAVAQTLTRLQPAAIDGMLAPWLQRSAQQTVASPRAGVGPWDRVASTLRARSGAALMFLNVSNTLQQITGAISATVKVRPAYMLGAVARYLANPRKFGRNVWALSPYMDDRANNEIAAINDTMQDILVNPSTYEKATRWGAQHAYFLQSAFDNVLSPIVWGGAYEQARADGMAHHDAVRFADSTVAQTQGSTLPEDVSRIETGNPWLRLFTQFAGYFNMVANTNVTALQQLAADGGLKRHKARALYILFAGMLMPLWVAEVIAQAFKGGPDDDEGDGYLDDWIAAVIGMGTVKGVMASIPVIGQLGTATVNQWNSQPMDDRLSLTPAVSILESTIRAPKSVYEAAVNDGSAQRAVRDVATAVSVFTGIPLLGVARPVGYLAGMEDGRIDPTSDADMVRGLISGVASPDSKQK